MLLPTTSIFVWWARRPEMAENIERSMGAEPLAGVVREGGGQGGQETSVMRPSGTALPPMVAVASVVSSPRTTEVTVPVCATPVSSVYVTEWPTTTPAFIVFCRATIERSEERR